MRETLGHAFDQAIASYGATSPARFEAALELLRHEAAHDGHEDFVYIFLYAKYMSMTAREAESRDREALCERLVAMREDPTLTMHLAEFSHERGEHHRARSLFTRAARRARESGEPSVAWTAERCARAERYA